MSMVKRRFSKAQKLEILREAKKHGVKETLSKHGIYPSTFYSWQRKLESMGEEGLSHGMTPGQQKEIRRLEKENQLLKQIIAEKELESKMKDELLKKKYPPTRRKNS